MSDELRREDDGLTTSWMRKNWVPMVQLIMLVFYAGSINERLNHISESLAEVKKQQYNYSAILTSTAVLESRINSLEKEFKK